MNESKPEIGRAVASQKSSVSITVLKKIQTNYNKIRTLRNFKFILQKDLGEQDSEFLKNADPQLHFPKARLVGDQLHIISTDSIIKLSVLDLKSGQYEINNHPWRITKPYEIQKDIQKIRQILNKGEVLGTENSNNSSQMAFAVYGLSYIANQFKK